MSVGPSFVFDDERNRVPFCEPEFPEEDHAPPGSDPLEVARRFWLICGADQTAEESGRRLQLLAHVARWPGAARTQRELAARMALSAARVNKILRVFRRELEAIAPGE